MAAIVRSMLGLRRLPAVARVYSQWHSELAQDESLTKPLSPEQIMRIRERDAELRRRHTVLELNAIVGKGDEGAVNEDEVRRKRLIYRSKQRGWLEVDLLLGSWASAHVPSLKGEQLEQYERILNQETIDIYNIITKQIPPPPGVDSPVLRILQDYASSKPFGANKETYATMKAKANLI